MKNLPSALLSVFKNGKDRIFNPIMDNNAECFANGRFLSNQEIIAKLKNAGFEVKTLTLEDEYKIADSALPFEKWVRYPNKESYMAALAAFYKNGEWPEII